MGSFNLTLKEKVIGGSVLGLICLFALIYYAVIKPRMEDTARIRAQVLSVNNQIQNTVKTIRMYRTKQAEVDEQSTFFQEKFLTRANQIPQILSILGDVVQKSNVDVVSVRPHKLKDGTWKSFQYQSLKITLQLRGKYLAFVDCLKRFLTIPFFVDITDVQLRKDEKGLLNMKLDLETYFLPRKT